MPVIPDLDGRTWWAALKSLGHEIDDKNLSLIAAGIAFYGLLTVFPGIAAVIAIWGLVGDRTIIMQQLEQLRVLLPGDVYSLLADQINNLTTAGTDALGLAGAISIILAIWSARRGVAALIRGMNAVYNEDSRSGIWHHVMAMILTFSLMIVALVALGTVVVMPVLMALLPLGEGITLILEILRWVIVVAVLLIGAGLVYRYGPNRRTARLAWITPGAVLAVILWAVASAGFSLYLRNLGNYNEIYGSLGAVAALMVWLYISGLLLLLGAAVNAQLERHTEPDSTVGADRPRGQRGAEAADTFIDT
jgi:membrane protein